MSDYEEQQAEALFEEWNERTKGGTKYTKIYNCPKCGEPMPAYKLHRCKQ